MNREAKVQRLIGELVARLDELDQIGELVAAAHLQSAIDCLRMTPKEEEDRSKAE
ncbi:MULTISPECIES: hypothetical protein [Novosphingobium]|uniref:hypothetical protein n=1 Tax=Novosphingobium sp. TaxID=1874826 RepID=UPI00163DB331|nr:hypothetical protein [Novosphingobium sp.]